MKLLKIVLIIFLAMNSFVLEGCKPSVPGTYVNPKDGILSLEIKSNGKYRFFNADGDEAFGKYEVNDNIITFTMYSTQKKGEIKGESIIMENGDIWKKIK
jgi:hypothetical protein